MMRVALLNVVGLTAPLLDRMPKLRAFAAKARVRSIIPAFPAVTCTAQSNYLTGLTPSEHGIVGNGWYDRELAEVHFWKQSNRLVQGKKVWEELREIRPGFTCANLFWWYNMYSTVDYSITPRPMYPADGRKFFDVYTAPFSIRHEIKKDLGEFPFRNFWGPGAGIGSSRWIAESAKWIEERQHPDLTLIYLPHLDYNLQKLGPNHPAIADDLVQLDTLVSDLITYLQERGIAIAIVSEYGITEVDRPIHLNRIFREQGWIAIKDELGLEMIDCGASKVFAVADHQVAQIYVADPALARRAREVVEAQPGVCAVVDQIHRRSGDFIAVADERSWFTYYYWVDDTVAPDFARTVDIHRKIGYDPVELFIDPAIKFPALNVASFLLKKKLGIRGLLSVIPLDPKLVRGSHGRVPERGEDRPILIVGEELEGVGSELSSTGVYGVIKQLCLAD
jgi:predicted AlkP superfamily pyrophosphatase or phosphodiesterase